MNCQRSRKDSWSSKESERLKITFDVLPAWLPGILSMLELAYGVAKGKVTGSNPTAAWALPLYFVEPSACTTRGMWLLLAGSSCSSALLGPPHLSHCQVGVVLFLTLPVQAVLGIHCSGSIMSRKGRHSEAFLPVWRSEVGNTLSGMQSSLSRSHMGPRPPHPHPLASRLGLE